MGLIQTYSDSFYYDEERFQRDGLNGILGVVLAGYLEVHKSTCPYSIITLFFVMTVPNKIRASTAISE